MKRFRFAWIVILLVFIIVTVNGQSSTRSTILTEIYQKDYELINRTVFTFNNRPAYRIIERGENRQIIIHIDNAAIHELVALNQNFDSPILRSIQLSEGAAGRATITIHTHQPVHLRSFEIQVPENKIVLDIYNKLTPENDEEKFIFAKYYYATSDFRRAENLLREIAASSPQITGVNYYLGELHLSRNEDRKAAERYAEVSFRDEEYLQARAQLMKLGVINPSYNDEIEETYSAFHNYFLQAEDLNRQTFLLALVSSPFGDINRTRNLLAKIDYTDPVISHMTNNIDLLYEHLSRDKELQHLLPASSTVTNRNTSPLPWYIIIILTALVTAIIVVLINNVFWNRRIKNSRIKPASRTEPVKTETPSVKQPPTSKAEKLGEQKKPKFISKNEVPDKTIEQKKESKPEKDTGKSIGLQIPPQYAAEILQETEKEIKKKEKLVADYIKPEETSKKSEPREFRDEKPVEPERDTPVIQKDNEGSKLQGMQGKEVDIDEELERVEGFLSEQDLNKEIEEREESETSREHPSELESPETDEKIGLGSWPQKQEKPEENKAEKEEESTLEEEEAFSRLEEQEGTNKDELPQKETAASESEKTKESVDQQAVDLEGVLKDSITREELSPKEKEKPVSEESKSSQAGSEVEEAQQTEQTQKEKTVDEGKTGFGYQPPRDLDEESDYYRSEQKAPEKEESVSSNDQFTIEKKKEKIESHSDTTRWDDQKRKIEDQSRSKPVSSKGEEKIDGKGPDLQPSTMIFEDLKVKLIVQLYQLGWGAEAIAEEMEADVSEIKKVIASECNNR